MKNIFIIGIARSGKSTLSRLIKEKYPMYNQFSFEAIRNGFIKTQPELNMNNRNSEARKNILPAHIVEFVHWNNEILKNPSLIEGDFCSCEALYSLMNENDKLICLGLGCRSLDEIVLGIKEHDTTDDYTYEWDEERIKQHFNSSIERDKENYEFCIENNIKYYDTFENRSKIFESIIQNIKDENSKNKINKRS